MTGPLGDDSGGLVFCGVLALDSCRPFDKPSETLRGRVIEDLGRGKAVLC